MSAGRELLELAEKAAGMNAEWHNIYDADYDAEHEGMWLKGRRTADNNAYWNPLTNDGDALRLAAALRLQIRPGKHKGDGCTVETQRSGIAGCTAFYDDEAQQMRCAIVCAAAEIGRSMP